MGGENIWYTINRSYDNAIGQKIIAYNLFIISNMRAGDKPKDIMKIDSY